MAAAIRHGSLALIVPLSLPCFMCKPSTGLTSQEGHRRRQAWNQTSAILGFFPQARSVAIGMFANNFIEMNRTFRHLAETARDDDDDSFQRADSGEHVDWKQLTQEYRVIILSEAGSGKTVEIRQRARVLAQSGFPSFFLRLEHIAQEDFESAFEEGSHEDFQGWLNGNGEGWLFLDSVDESRLQSPKDFERAIRKVGRQLIKAQDRIHVVITGRISAWRPKSDLVLCEEQLPCAAVRRDETASKGVFKIYSLGDLTPNQLEIFAIEKGVKNVKQFRDDIERADAWTFAARPQDLEELIGFWLTHGRIGSRLELMQNSIDRRLKEQDPNRDEVWTLSIERAREGAMKIAAACTLAQEQIIRVPDGVTRGKGLAINEILPDWHGCDQAILLARPIFDEAIYGTVRFHHRSVREYLTAEWFAKLLRIRTSRRRIEALFFKWQYGLEVVVPTLRPVLPWLCVLDAGIAERVSRVAPEVFFEGGDPSRLPLSIRRSSLWRVCEQIAGGSLVQAVSDHMAVQRFAAADIMDDVGELIQKYSDNDELLYLLLKMAWLGRLVDVLPKAIDIAMSVDCASHVRVAAINAVMALGSSRDKKHLCVQFLNQDNLLDRNCLAALLEKMESTAETLEWLVECLCKLEDPRYRVVDQLEGCLHNFVKRSDISLLPSFVARVNEMLERRPFIEQIEQRGVKVSAKYSWLLGVAAIAVKRLVDVQISDSLECASLAILYKLPKVQQHAFQRSENLHRQLGNSVSKWKCLNRSLFWYSVEQERQRKKAMDETSQADWWNFFAWGSFVRLDGSDFDWAVSDIAEQSLMEDKLVALSLAFRLCAEEGGPVDKWKMLKQKVGGSEALSSFLSELKYPIPPAEEMRWAVESDLRLNRLREQQIEAKRLHAESLYRCILLNNKEFRCCVGNASVEVWDARSYLYHYIGEHGSDSFAGINCEWQVLMEKFGRTVAESFKAWVVGFWRNNRPKLMSEGASSLRSSLPFEGFGLMGMAIEAQENSDWLKSLDEDQVRLVFRYALYAPNGFSEWVFRLHVCFPGIVLEMTIKELEFELETSFDGEGGYSLLREVNLCGDWIWNDVASKLIDMVTGYEPESLTKTEFVLDIIRKSNIDVVKIAQLCEAKVNFVRDAEHVVRWLALWTVVDPSRAIDKLVKCINALSVETDRGYFVAEYLIQVAGMGINNFSAHKTYRDPVHLKRIMLIALPYLKSEDDFIRGVGLLECQLDNQAERAFDRLLSMLMKMPGKKAFEVLDNISSQHPKQRKRSWIKLLLQEKAKCDADTTPWVVARVLEFGKSLVCSPSSVEDLFGLVVSQLEDLKNDLENGDKSIASVIRKIKQEPELRNFIGAWCRKDTGAWCVISQEEELADAKRTDLRWYGNGIEASVPVELKLADKWSGSKLKERLRVQLCGNYMRDVHSGYGVFLLVNRDARRQWVLSRAGEKLGFDGLVQALQDYWRSISSEFSNVEDIRVIGIDLTKRFHSQVH